MSAASLEDPKNRLDRLKNEKARLGHLISEARRSGEIISEHWSNELREVSREIKQLHKLAKQQLNGAQVEEKWAPLELIPPPSIVDNAVDRPITIKPCVGEMSAAADNYVAQHPGASIWHRPAISSFIAKTYGHRTRYLCAVAESGNLVGILPLVQLNSRLFGNFLVSVPFFNYGGVLADNAKVAHQLIEAADQWRQQVGARHLEMRHIQDNGLGLPQRTDKVTFWLSLPEQSDMLWNSFKPKLRAQIRRGDRELSDLSVGGLELLNEFYRVFSVNMRDLGTPVYSRAFFRNLLEKLEGQSWLVVARIDGRPAGCAFLVGYRDRLEIPWASTLRDFSHTAINMIMYWRILEFAVAQGYKVFDFGRCTENAGTYRFKQQWGAQPIDLYWDYLLPAGEKLPALNPENPKYRLLIAAWRRLPIGVANLLGPRIVRMLP